jgi:hypothetical protein
VIIKFGKISILNLLTSQFCNLFNLRKKQNDTFHTIGAKDFVLIEKARRKLIVEEPTNRYAIHYSGTT